MIDQEKYQAYVDEIKLTIGVDDLIYNDPLLVFQSNLFGYDPVHNGYGAHVNILPVWEDYSGKNIVVGTYEFIEDTQPDLNYNSALTVSYTTDARHGTATAGVISAKGNNGAGTVGVAPDSIISTIYSSNSELVDVFTNSTGGGRPFKGFTWSERANYIEATESGRGGLGTITISSSGNGKGLWADVNTDATDALRSTLSIGRVEQNGNLHSSSTTGANLFAVTPVWFSYSDEYLLTTDVSGAEGYNNGLHSSPFDADNPDSPYPWGLTLVDEQTYFDFGMDDGNNAAFNGTSAAAPIMAGVAAVILEVNSELGWRDMQDIIAYSAEHTGYFQVDEFVDPEQYYFINLGTNSKGGTDLLLGNYYFGWQFNQADNHNGGGLHFSRDYGYGLVNAHAAVRLAETWTDQKNSENEISSLTTVVSQDTALQDMDTLTYTIQVNDQIDIDHVVLNMHMDHELWSDLIITITSPEGTSEYLLYKPYKDQTDSSYITSGEVPAWEMSAQTFRGEESLGEWTITISDSAAGNTGTLKGLELQIYGDAITNDDLYLYTEEFSEFYTSERGILNDTNSGVDTINAASITSDTVFDLSSGGTLDGQNLNIGSGTIENFYAGDGNDTITGNNSNNIIWGGRGDDILDGSVGTDTVWYKGLLSDFSFAFNSLYDVTVEAISGIDWGIDQLLNFELFQFDDVTRSAQELFDEFGTPDPATLPQDGLVWSLTDNIQFGDIGDITAVNRTANLQKTHSMQFTTGSDVNTTQIIYEQGGTIRGMNMVIEGGKLYAALWNKAEENWGFKELQADIEANTEYNATLILDGALPANGSASLYLDGIQVDNISNVGQLYAHGDNIGLGSEAGSTLIHNSNPSGNLTFQGSIDKIAHYNSALSGSDLDQLHAYMGNDPLPQTEQVIMEFGSVQTDHNVITVDLDHVFENPVVFVTMTSFNGSDVAVPRVSNVQNNSFELYAQEAEYLDGTHAVETFSYIVAEAGSWTLSDGTKLEVGTSNVSTLSKNGFDTINFASDFASSPTVLTQVQTTNDTVFVDTRQDDTTANGFKLALQEEELTNTGTHGTETVGWFAIEQGIGSDDGHDFVAGSTSNSFTHTFDDILFDDALDVLPQLIANISTHDGPDASFLRVDALGNNSASVQIQEDQSQDSETNHTTEIIDYFAIEGEGQLTGVSDTII